MVNLDFDRPRPPIAVRTVHAMVGSEVGRADLWCTDVGEWIDEMRC